jgi:transcriptional regulatory protein LevR
VCPLQLGHLHDTTVIYSGHGWASITAFCQHVLSSQALHHIQNYFHNTSCASSTFTNWRSMPTAVRSFICTNHITLCTSTFDHVSSGPAIFTRTTLIKHTHGALHRCTNNLQVPVSQRNELSVLFHVRCAVTSLIQIPSYKC